MKDRQIAPANAEPRIFFVSTLLHCVSMSALVFLRSSFGFSFLRPKSIFFALSWASGLYAVYAWIDGTAWRQESVMLCFGIAAFGLYWTHLAVACGREWTATGQHDQYAGTSHVVRLLRLSRRAASARFEERVSWWGEPTVVLLASCVCWRLSASKTLSWWLLLVSACLWSKESLNHWYRLRRQKRRADVFADTQEAVEPPASSDLALGPTQTVRKVQVKRARASARTGAEDVT